MLRKGCLVEFNQQELSRLQAPYSREELNKYMEPGDERKEPDVLRSLLEARVQSVRYQREVVNKIARWHEEGKTARWEQEMDRQVRERQAEARGREAEAEFATFPRPRLRSLGRTL